MAKINKAEVAQWVIIVGFLVMGLGQFFGALEQNAESFKEFSPK